MTDVIPLKTTFFDAIYETFPSELKHRVDNLLTGGGGVSDGDAAGETRLTFDRLLRFSLGGIHSEDDGGSQAEWNEAQSKLENVLSSLKATKGKKRGRDDEGDSAETVQQATKKTKLDSEVQNSNVDDSPIFTLHSFSVAVPVRKKVDITIRQRSICFTNPTTEAVESIIPTETLTRAFLLSTPGKSKAHWTIVLLANTEQNQVIFGTDNLLPSLKTTTHPEPLQTNPKGTSAEASLRKFLSHLPANIPLLEPSTSHFRSDNGEPWLDTYLRAKEGHLFFFPSGILFGLKKPCMWIGMEDIQNVRTLSVTGRTLSVFVTRQPKNAEEDEEGEETEFSMIDGKHQDSVSKWVKNNQHMFGVAQDEQQQLEQSADPEETEQGFNLNADLDDESDDSDYHSGSESDGGSPSSAGSSEEDDEAGDREGSDSGSEDGSEEEEDGVGEAEEEDENEDEPLDPSKHPLMAPGAVPRLSKAAMDAVIGMVERDLKGGSHSAATNGHEIDELGDEEDEEIDQLD